LTIKAIPPSNKDGNIILKPVAKLRGANVKNYAIDKNGDPWLVANVLPIWKDMRALPQPGDDSGLVTSDYKQFITIGWALSLGRWKLAGRWSPDVGEPEAYKRSINAHELGVKRMLDIYKLGQLINGDRPAKRTYELIATIPVMNRDVELSRSRPPEWISEETGEIMNNEDDVDNVAAGSRQAVF
jgi:hypothetical protein